MRQAVRDDFSDKVQVVDLTQIYGANKLWGYCVCLYRTDTSKIFDMYNMTCELQGRLAGLGRSHNWLGKR